jgi:hypothetical protein
MINKSGASERLLFISVQKVKPTASDSAFAKSLVPESRLTATELPKTTENKAAVDQKGPRVVSIYLLRTSLQPR